MHLAFKNVKNPFCQRSQTLSLKVETATPFYQKHNEATPTTPLFFSWRLAKAHEIQWKFQQSQHTDLRLRTSKEPTPPCDAELNQNVSCATAPIKAELEVNRVKPRKRLVPEMQTQNPKMKSEQSHCFLWWIDAPRVERDMPRLRIIKDSTRRQLSRYSLPKLWKIWSWEQGFAWKHQLQRRPWRWGLLSLAAYCSVVWFSYLFWRNLHYHCLFMSKA